jgi:ubiquitin-protein ligase
MSSPRIRRLTSDYVLLQKVFAGSPIIEILGVAGLPPELYRFTYKIKGLHVSPSGDIIERDTHLLEVNLTLGYPRRAPQCRMLTPIFHPNFDEASVCIGDFWAASEGLDDLIIRIGRMIAFQEYNTKSPLNGLAAKWASEHSYLLPIDNRNISPAGVVPANSALASQAGPRNETTPSFPSETQAVAVPVQSAVEDPWKTKIIIS